MATATLTLTDFLLARVAEDEAVTQAAFWDDRDMLGYGRGPRADDGRWSTGSHESDEERIDGIGITIYDEGGHNAAQAAHIARYDPARVLADCEAKRVIVAEHVIESGLSDYSRECGLGFSHGCLVCHEWDGIICGRGYCETLRALAAPYADHADYREEWRSLTSA